MTSDNYYPNPYFNEGHLESQLKTIAELHSQVGAILDLRRSVPNYNRFEYSTLIKTLKDAMHMLRVITTALDSMQPGMTYSRLSELSGFKVNEVKFILKHARPG